MDPEVTSQQNAALKQIPSTKEIRDVMSSIPIDSSLGPDGFGSDFF